MPTAIGIWTKSSIFSLFHYYISKMFMKIVNIVRQSVGNVSVLLCELNQATCICTCIYAQRPVGLLPE